MRRFSPIVLLAVVVVFTGSGRDEKQSGQGEKVNILTAQEKKEGWKLLFDGKTTNGWRAVSSEEFPHFRWKAKEGKLEIIPPKDRNSKVRSDIITVEQYGNFELKLEFKIREGRKANSGIKYFVQPGTRIGFEYQILSEQPRSKGRSALADLYVLVRATGGVTRPAGEWNEARIVVNGSHGEHWLNGRKVLEYKRHTPELRALIAKSKYSTFKNFGEFTKGHILLQ
ncbi:DUF1080 domain-containing protein, partial [Acidobacteria bacterium AH-259-A15]|nr:DUF1080 domain-containing protein [Acidobacteria bacterium AH-259-A15]